MRECSFCGAECDSQIGISKELKSVYWGGRRNGNVEFSPKVVAFFCSEEHRSEFELQAIPGGEIQTERWNHNGEDNDEIPVAQ